MSVILVVDNVLQVYVRVRLQILYGCGRGRRREDGCRGEEMGVEEGMGEGVGERGWRRGWRKGDRYKDGSKLRCTL